MNSKNDFRIVSSFNYLLKVIERNNFTYKLYSDCISLFLDKEGLGKFASVEEALDYCFGFETGYSKGKNSKNKMCPRHGKVKYE